MTAATSASQAEATRQVRGAILTSLERRDPLIVLTGASGTGKSALYRSVIESSERVAACIILNPFLTFHDLLRQVVADLNLIGGQWSSDEDLALAATEHDLIQLIQRFVESNPQRLAVVVIDDAHLINLVVLSKLRALLNLSAGDHGLTVLLVGQPALEDTLRRAEFQSVQQRIAARHRLGSPAPTPATMPVPAPTPAPPPPPIRPRAIPPKPSGSSAAAKPGTSSVAALKRRSAMRQLAATGALVTVVGSVMVWSWRWATSTAPDTSTPPDPTRAAAPSSAPKSPAAPARSPEPVSQPAPTPPAAEAAVPRPVPVPPAAERPARQPSAESRSAPKAPPHPDDLDAKFNALRQNTERQARILTSKGDVKALLALRADTSKRYQQLGASRPEFLAEVLQALDAKIDEARAIRLRLDAEVFRR